MVYTTALVLGQGHGGMPTTTTLISEEEEEQQSLVEMIGNFLSQLISSEKSRSSRCVAAADRRGSVDSCDSEADKNSPYTDLHSRLEEEEEDEARLLQRDMTRQIECCLSEAKGSAALPYCEMLLLPRHLSARVGRDLVRSSAGEPCGLRGASVHVYLQESESSTTNLKDAPPLKALGSFSPEPSVTPTFELSVVFKVDHGGWPPALKHMFVTDNKVLKLRPEYRLVKRKLYSSASPVVRDFS